MRRAPAFLALLLLASPALAQTDAERAQALRDAADALHGAIETLEGAAAILERVAGAEAAAGTEAAEGLPEIEETSQVTLLDPFDTPLEIPAEDVTAAVEHLRATAENAHAGDEAAIAAGEKLYATLCAACHLKDEDGIRRIGPGLVDDNWA